MEFKGLGKKATEYTGLEVFPRPERVTAIEMVSDEVTALCPVTGQPDQYTVTINYVPKARCIESKSLKLLFQSLREKGVFCEQLSADLVNEIVTYADPYFVEVSVNQKPRGGISINAFSRSAQGEV